jgi:Mrp family chromosome partitioning ATPase
MGQAFCLPHSFLLGGKMRKIVVAFIKGGVGKTTVSSGLTRSLKRLGFSVGYIEKKKNNQQGRAYKND